MKTNNHPALQPETTEAQPLTTTTNGEHSSFIEQDKLWEINHARVAQAINAHIEAYGTMPNKT